MTSPTPLQCNAFSTPFKAIAVFLVTMAMLWAWQLASKGTLQPTLASSGWLAAALVVMGVTEWHILRGRTTLSTTTLEQSWIWRKHVVLSDISYAKFMRVPGLEWLIAPRLYTKTHTGKMAVFYAAHPAMWEEFARLEKMPR